MISDGGGDGKVEFGVVKVASAQRPVWECYKYVFRPTSGAMALTCIS